MRPSPTRRRARADVCAVMVLALAACVPDVAPVEPLPPADSGAGGALDGDPTGLGGEGGGDAAGGGDTEVVAERDPERDVCDLTGAWVVTEKMVLNAVGAKQEVRLWRYVELVQEGDAVEVSKSLVCGDTVKGLPPVVVTMDSSKMWGALLTHGTMKGRRGTSRKASNGCAVAFERAVEVRGATESAYVDLGRTLPTSSEKASGDTPGWEDWDGDGNPGVSVRVSGTLSGTLHLTSRTWTEWSGNVDPSKGKFKLPMKWKQERSTLGVNGSPLLSLEGGGADPDPSLHFAEFAFVSADELGDTDEARCARVRTLAPTLTPGL